LTSTHSRGYQVCLPSDTLASAPPTGQVLGFAIGIETARDARPFQVARHYRIGPNWRPRFDLLVEGVRAFGNASLFAFQYGIFASL
jgi:hypothetical protein